MLATGTTPIVWSLWQKLFSPVFLQRHPIWTGWRGIPRLPGTPWDDADRPPSINYGKVDAEPKSADTLPTNAGLAALGLVSTPLKNFLHPPRPLPYSEQFTEPSCIHPLPIPAVVKTISGVTRDETGAAAGGYTVHLLRMVTGEKPVIEGVTVSDASGNYSFAVNPTSNYWCVDYKLGSPDKSGATNTTLTGI